MALLMRSSNIKILKIREGVLVLGGVVAGLHHPRVCLLNLEAKFWSEGGFSVQKSMCM